MNRSFMRLNLLVLCFAICLAACLRSDGQNRQAHGGAAANTAKDYGAIRTPFDTRVPVPPIPFTGDGKIQLAYELYITNFGKYARTLKRVDILGDDGAILTTLQCDDLKDNTRRPGTKADEVDARVINIATIAVVYLWVIVDNWVAVPNSLRHRLYFHAEDAPDDILETPPVKVDNRAILALSPPLRGGDWFCWDAPSNSTPNHHRHGLFAIGGQAHLAERLAIDYLKIGDNNMLIRSGTDGLKNADWWGHGEDLLAVADGVVLEAKDGIPENVPMSPVMAVPITTDTICGNFVILDLGGGYYALYAHMIPGSVLVKPGDNVVRGQVLGKLGNTGNSSAPHLHFHICNVPSPLISEGVPYTINSFTLHNYWDPDMYILPNIIWVPQPGMVRNFEMPLDKAVLSFP